MVLGRLRSLFCLCLCQGFFGGAQFLCFFVVRRLSLVVRLLCCCASLFCLGESLPRLIPAGSCLVEGCLGLGALFTLRGQGFLGTLEVTA